MSSCMSSRPRLQLPAARPVLGQLRSVHATRAASVDVVPDRHIRGAMHQGRARGRESLLQRDLYFVSDYMWLYLLMVFLAVFIIF